MGARAAGRARAGLWGRGPRRPSQWLAEWGLALAGLLLLTGPGAQAQLTPAPPPATRRVADTLRLDRDTLRLSTVGLLPGRDTLRVGGRVVARSAYRVLPRPGLLVLLDGSLRGQVAVVSYWVVVLPALGVPLPGVRRAADAPASPPNATRPATAPPPESESAVDAPEASATNLFDDLPRLERSGSIGRAITLGSNRDLAVNSDFRLQLSGRLSDDLEVAAALTDENIPIQPSGNTQQLADFDRIFIQLKQRQRVLTFGDLEAIQRGTSFANLYRNVQGLAYRTEGPRRTFATVANARGRFHTNSFAGENGRQGPYRLTGRDGERFMIVLAGSERVYLNGRLMVRGEGRDYVIDYNTAELTFTPRVLIDVNTRIVVDFEYAVQQYARSLVFLSHAQSLWADRLQLRLSYAREADDPDAPIGQPLRPADRTALEQAGDDAANISGVDSVGYSTLEVRYAAVDTVIGGSAVRFFRRSLDPLLGLYRVTFSAVGAGRGEYVREAALVNGNVFRYVGRDALGRPLGDYQPVLRLATPRLLQVAMLGADYRLGRRLTAFTETAVSDEDRNRLSSRDDGNNVGVATRTGLRLAATPLGAGLSLGAEAVGQYVDAAFENLDRVYRFEYGREWNFNDLAPRGIERLGELSTELRHTRGYRLRVAGGLRQLGDSLRTQRLTLEGESSDSAALLGKHLMVLLATENPLTQSRSTWARHNGDVYALLGPRRQPWMRLGSELWIETRRERQADTLRAGTFDFVDLKPYVRSLPGRRWQWEAAATLRTDREWTQGALRDKATTLKPSLSVAYSRGANFSTSLTATYLDYRVRDTAFFRQGLADQQALQSLLQLNAQSANRLWAGGLFYEVSTERIARRQLVYVKVNPGLGQYDWFDYNGNGVEDLNEFELSANPLTANYIRVLVPTPELQPTVRAALGTNLRLDLGRVVADGPGLRRLLHNLSSQTNLRLDQRRSAPSGELQSYLVQFSRLDRADSTLLSAVLQLRQDLYFFRNNRVGDFSFSYLVNQNLQFLNSGSEERAGRTWQARQRLNLDPVRSLDNVVLVGTRRSRAQLLPTRNFDLELVSAQPAFNQQLARRWRLTVGYEFARRRARSPEGLELGTLTAHKLITDVRLGFGARNNLSTRLEVLNNQLEGTPNASVRFELLEGLQPGRNLVCNLMLVQYLSRVLEFSVVYDGRAAAQVPMLHSARVQLRALF